MSKCQLCNGNGYCKDSIFNDDDGKCQLWYGTCEVNYTCDKCDVKDTCEFVFDSYNTNGDCIAER